MAENDSVPTAPDNTGKANADEPVLTPEPQGVEGAPAPKGEGQDKPADVAGNDEDANGILSPGAGDGEGEKDTGAPEQYEAFTLPEGFTLDEDGKAELEGLFRGMNLSQKGGQKLVDAYVKQRTADKEAELLALTGKRKQWRAELKARPDYAEQRALAKKGMAAIVSTPQERELFQNTWLSDRPELFDMFVKVGRLVGEDTPLPSGGSGPVEDSALRRFPIKAR